MLKIFKILSSKGRDSPKKVKLNTSSFPRLIRIYQPSIKKNHPERDTEVYFYFWGVNEFWGKILRNLSKNRKKLKGVYISWNSYFIFYYFFYFISYKFSFKFMNSFSLFFFLQKQCQTLLGLGRTVSPVHF